MRAKSKTFVILTLFSLLTLISCRGDADTTASQTTEDMSDSQSGGDDFGAFPGGFGADAQWPDYIPADIPELEGEIRLVMEAPDSHIRIFYENVSKDQVLDYLDQLESMGFALEYRIYVQEGFPDRSEEKEKRGDFDDVDITKGEYHMTITYGADPTYDIYTSGFREAAIEATTLQWPSDLPKSVPPIPNCVLQTINPSKFEGYHITCKKEAENVEEAYIQLLVGSGFEEKNGTTLQSIVMETTVYENADAIVRPDVGFSPTFFSIQVYQKIEPEPLPWPEDIAALVPPPEACALTNILRISEGEYMINCQAGSDDASLAYIQTLEASGFSEQEKFEGPDGTIISITLEKEGTAVTILGGAPSTLTIQIGPTNP